MAISLGKADRMPQCSSVEAGRRQFLVALGASLAALRLTSVRAASLDLSNWARAGLLFSADGLVSVFGLEPDVADEVLLRATRVDALPDGYAPRDLVDTLSAGIPADGSQRVRRLIVPDTRRMIAAAGEAGYDLYVGSGFRSQAYQAQVFAAQTSRFGNPDMAERYSARPGHSQHQLGTTIDFTSAFRGFRGSDTAAWLEAHAHEFGFVLPYTPSSQACTGYIDEPWHARWVGISLATSLQALDYQSWTDQCADDAIAAVRQAAGFS
jgi:LAS superfamily LD-carboxypeptidase LdcB